MDTASRPPKRWGRWLAGVLLAIIGLSVFAYIQLAQPDGEVARLKVEIRKAGLDISDRGQQRYVFPKLTKLGAQLKLLEVTAYSKMTLEQRVRYIKGGEPIYQQMKALSIDDSRGDGWADLDQYRAVQFCSLRAAFYADSDPEQTLDSLHTLRTLASELGRRGVTFPLRTYCIAYEGTIAAWIHRPELLERARQVSPPEVHPMKYLERRVDEITLAFQDLKMVYSASPKELWDNFNSFKSWKQEEREFYRQVLAMLRGTKTRTPLALAVSTSRILDSLPLPDRKIGQGRLFDGFSLDLEYISKVEISHQQCEAYIEMQHTDPKANLLPKREPFIDPFSGESFLLRRENGAVWIISVGPNGRDDHGLEDDIVAKYRLQPPSSS